MGDLDGIKVGDWITCTTPGGGTIRGQVATIDADVHGITTYTMHQYPSDPAQPSIQYARYWDADWNEITDA